MSGLLNPMPGHTVYQPFAGVYAGEKPGWLRMSGGKPWYAKRVKFADSIKKAHLHGGVDVGCPVGTPIRAPERMKIVLARTDPETGDHYVFGEVRKGTVLEFSHTSKLLVPVGEVVDRGEHFALSGASGHVTGPHLHWMVLHTTNPKPDLNDVFKMWAMHDPLRCLTGADKAGRPWLVPTH